MDMKRIIGGSAILANALDHASQLASINRPILIVGERGSGKELFAERLHFLSPRWEQPFIKLNCAAFSESLLDSELFGHDSGAFTGATKNHLGRFERAQGGTLFLDELATMSGQLQEKLLRVIEYGEFERVGGSRTINCDVRVIGATHADLKLMVSQGTFRADLLDRLSFDVIQVPPLRSRPEDIQELSEHFALRICHELNWPYFPGFTHEAIATLMEYSWPGNIRELRNVVERSIFRHGKETSPVSQVLLNPFGKSDTDAIKYTASEYQEEHTEKSINFENEVNNFKKALLFTYLERNQYSQKKTAVDLQLSYDQLRGLIRKYGLDKTI